MVNSKSVWQNGGTDLAKRWHKFGSKMTMTWHKVCVMLVLSKTGRSDKALF